MWYACAMSHTTVKMGDRGRLVIPAEVRRNLGLKAGDELRIEETDGELRVLPLATRVRRLRGAYKHLAPGRSLADELIAERREEARRE